MKRRNGKLIMKEGKRSLQIVAYGVLNGKWDAISFSLEGVS